MGTLVGRNAHLRAILNLAARHGVRTKMKTYSLKRLNELMGDYHRGPPPGGGEEPAVDVIKWDLRLSLHRNCG